MVNRWKLLVRITAAVLIGILLYGQIGPIAVEASTAIAKGDVSKNQIVIAPFIWTAIIVGGSIIVTLSYVSWRKYKAEAKEVGKKDKSVD
ncbi:sporulation protein YpjB [Oceanobacillus massiliensis]|uniref:sporulation protein YpjB n=1 Tax=Oceanobacillus massiliensis TaxID=1465765 RepID=UPI003019A726